MAIIADTGALLAMSDEDDDYHRIVVRFITSIKEAVIVPSPVVGELCYMLLENLGTEAELNFLRSLAKREMLLEHFTHHDLDRAIEILEQYRDAEFGVVDALTMAMAERLKIKTILTIDRRDFSLFRPRHCDAFTLVPDLPPGKTNKQKAGV
ncbi:MAG: type II toxin-antitoxin system VapC family toxin [Blastocatellia bacterium]